MHVEIEINSTKEAVGRYLTWTPSPCRIRVSDPSGLPVGSGTVSINIEGQSDPNGGEVVFRNGSLGVFSPQIQIEVPVSGESVPFQTAGIYEKPSERDGDVRIIAREAGNIVGQVPVMVRIRKNANKLSIDERDRFVSAFAKLNSQGMGRFTDFREMHTRNASAQAHGGPGFLPWHRIYLLDLERELQIIDPSIALPYWRFDQPARNLFQRNFLGEANVSGAVQFDPSNPLFFWTTDGIQGFQRRPHFNTISQPANNVINESDTLRLGGTNNTYSSFRTMEGNPHGNAHTNFIGPIMSVSTAARDPLFFLLHCNVDRLWAKWQSNFGRFDPNDRDSYDSGVQRINHNLSDTMWPWNGATGGDRPPTAPGGELSRSSCVSAPGPQPRVEQTLDYQGQVSSVNRLGYDYDDVSYN